MNSDTLKVESCYCELLQCLPRWGVLKRLTLDLAESIRKIGKAELVGSRTRTRTRTRKGGYATHPEADSFCFTCILISAIATPTIHPYVGSIDIASKRTGNEGDGRSDFLWLSKSITRIGKHFFDHIGLNHFPFCSPALLCCNFSKEILHAWRPDRSGRYRIGRD